MSSYTGTYRVYIDWDNNGNFTGPYDDVSADVRGRIAWDYGFANSYERVAMVGTCEFELDNTWFNQHGEKGLYSMDNAASSLAGKVMPMKPVAVEVTYNAKTRRMWTGYIGDIQPDPEMGVVAFRCFDYMHALVSTRIGSLLYTNVKAGFLVTAVLGNIFTAIPTDCDEGNQTFPFAGDRWQYEQVTGHEAMRHIAESEWGRFWFSREGVGTYRDTYFEFEDDTSRATFDKSMAQLLTSREARDIINRWSVEMTPREVGNTPIVVAKLDNLPYLNPGETSPTYTLRFRDPDTGRPIAVAEEIPLVPGTDYEPSSGIVVPLYSSSATSVTFNIRNTNDYPVQMTKWQLRGYPVYEYEPVIFTAEDTTSQSAYTFGKPKSQSLRLELTNNPIFAQRLAQYLVSRYARPFTTVEGIVVENLSAAQYEAMLDLEVMDLITLTDGAGLGYSGDLFRIIYARHEVEGARHRVTYRLEPYNDRNYARWSSGTWDDATWAPL